MLEENKFRGSLQDVGVQHSNIIGLLRHIRRDKSLSEDQVALLAAEKVTPVLSHDRDSTHFPSGDGVQAQDPDVAPDLCREEPHRRKEDAQHSTLRHGEVPRLGRTVEVKIIIVPLSNISVEWHA